MGRSEPFIRGFGTRISTGIAGLLGALQQAQRDDRRTQSVAWIVLSEDIVLGEIGQPGGKSSIGANLFGDP